MTVWQWFWTMTCAGACLVQAGFFVGLTVGIWSALAWYRSRLDEAMGALAEAVSRHGQDGHG